MNRKFKIGLFWLLMIGAVAGAAYGYHETYGLKDDAAKHLTPVVIGYQKADPVDISRQHGVLAKTLKKAGYKVTFKEFQSGAALNTALNAGNIDYARAGDVPPVAAQANGMDFVYVAAGADKVHGSGIEVKKSGSIAKLSDLKGKRIAYTKGTSSQYMVLMALQKAGLTTKDVTLVDMDQNAAAVAFAKGTIDAWATWDPYSATAEVTGGAKLLVDDTGLAKNRDYLLSTRKFATKHKALSKTLTKALSSDMTWANNNQAALSKMLVKTLKLNAKVVNKMLARRSFSMGAVTQANIKEQQAIADEFFAQKLVTKHVTISDYVIK